MRGKKKKKSRERPGSAWELGYFIQSSQQRSHSRGYMWANPEGREKTNTVGDEYTRQRRHRCPQEHLPGVSQDNQGAWGAGAQGARRQSSEVWTERPRGCTDTATTGRPTWREIRTVFPCSKLFQKFPGKWFFRIPRKINQEIGGKYYNSPICLAINTESIDIKFKSREGKAGMQTEGWGQHFRELEQEHKEEKQSQFSPNPQSCLQLLACSKCVFLVLSPANGESVLQIKLITMYGMLHVNTDSVQCC